MFRVMDRPSSAVGSLVMCLQYAEGAREGQQSVVIGYYEEGKRAGPACHYNARGDEGGVRDIPDPFCFPCICSKPR